MSLNDHTQLIDCQFCDGTLRPNETHCSFCGNFNRHLQDCASCIVCGKEFGILVGEEQDKCRDHRRCGCQICDKYVREIIEKPIEVKH